MQPGQKLLLFCKFNAIFFITNDSTSLKIRVTFRIMELSLSK